MHEELPTELVEAAYIPRFANTATGAATCVAIVIELPIRCSMLVRPIFSQFLTLTDCYLVGQRRVQG